MRIIFVPQFPSEMRYQAWWISEFPKQFRDHGFEVLTLGESCITSMKYRRSELDMFSPINQAIEFEMKQIKEYMSLDIKEDDILFVADLSFPGIFCSVLYHKECPKSYAFCHATSLNKYDYFENTRYSKFPAETAHSRMFDTVFVGSDYHKDKLHMGLQNNIHNWVNTKVTYLPMSPFITYKEDKIYNIISVARPTKQKVDLDIENRVQKNICNITRNVFYNWESYYKFISKSKILLVTSSEDTFNYTILEALMNNTIVLAPNRLCFPEMLSTEFLYNSYDELEQKIFKYLKDYKNVPEIKCKKEVDNFFDVICEEMKGG